MNKQDGSHLETSIEALIASVGENPQRDGLVGTPTRFLKQMQECLVGYKDDPKKHIKLFDSEGFHDLVVVSDISFSSICEHHILPFYGRVDIGYLPGKQILGLSKFARIVDAFSKRLQVQERLTKQLADFLEEQLHPELLMVRITAEHTCMIVRGVARPESNTETFTVRGKSAGREQFIEQFRRQSA